MRFGIIIGGLVLGSPVDAGESGGDAIPKFQYPPEHPCSVSTRPPGCRALDRIAYPDWNAAEDLMIVPHRGLWGFGDYVGVPENSAEGFVNVAVAGYSGLEADFMPSANGTMMSHDYVLTRLTSVPPSDRRRVYEQKSEELERLRLRDRAGKVSAATKTASGDV